MNASDELCIFRWSVRAGRDWSTMAGHSNPKLCRSNHKLGHNNPKISHNNPKLCHSNPKLCQFSGGQSYVLVETGVPWLAQQMHDAAGRFKYLKIKRLDTSSLASKLRILKQKQAAEVRNVSSPQAASTVQGSRSISQNTKKHTSKKFGHFKKNVIKAK